jgi:hypothetical protein
MTQGAVTTESMIMNKAQAYALVAGLDLYMRLSMGQIEELSMVARGFLKGVRNLDAQTEILFAVN